VTGLGPTDWALLRRLPYIIPGELLGVFFLAWVSDGVLKVLIGVLLLALLVPQVVEMIRGRRARTGEGNEAAPGAARR